MLASLARDYLCVTGASTPQEREFSAAADICTRDRGRIHPTTIETRVGSRMLLHQKVPLAHKFSAVEEAIEALGGWGKTCESS